MRERIHQAVNAKDLSWDPDREKDIDILTAMGMTDNYSRVNMLGGLLFALKGGALNKSDFYFPGNDRYNEDQRDAALTLAEVARHHKELRSLRPGLRNRLAALAVVEWLHDNCPDCNGNGLKKSGNGVMIECQTCKGCGKRRYSDYDRISILFEMDIKTYDTDKARRGESKAVRRRNRDRFIEGLERKYNRHCDRPMFILHGFLGLAQKDKAATVAHVLGRW
jgi:hypothetical protein